MPESRAVARNAVILITSLLVAAFAIGCGGGDDDSDPQTPGTSAFERQLAAAEKVTAADFPPTNGRTLQAIADTVQPGPQVGLATSEYVAGRTNRVAFGMIDPQQRFLYGKSALYIARNPNAKAEGPFPAPADSLVTEPPFRSQNAAQEQDAIGAIYDAEAPLGKPGRYAVLAVTEVNGQLMGAPTELTAKRATKIPDVGDVAPKVETDTVASAGGDIKSIDTREPPSDMHNVSFSEVAGKKPTVLLFATPALCQTRVCGPVTDIALQLKKEYGDRVEFIQQEVYEDNDPAKGLRKPLREFNLRTEPWLFTVDKNGRIAARLEGSFGLREFREAIEAALQGAPKTGSGS
jgi:hypothetical protein